MCAYLISRTYTTAYSSYSNSGQFGVQLLSTRPCSQSCVFVLVPMQLSSYYKSVCRTHLYAYFNYDLERKEKGPNLSRLQHDSIYGFRLTQLYRRIYILQQERSGKDLRLSVQLSMGCQSVYHPRIQVQQYIYCSYCSFFLSGTMKQFDNFPLSSLYLRVVTSLILYFRVKDSFAGIQFISIKSQKERQPKKEE